MPDDAKGVAVVGELVYVTAWTSGLRVIDVSDPTAPVEIGSIDTPGNARNVAVVGSFAYVADSFEGPAGDRHLRSGRPG